MKHVLSHTKLTYRTYDICFSNCHKEIEIANVLPQSIQNTRFVCVIDNFQCRSRIDSIFMRKTTPLTHIQYRKLGHYIENIPSFFVTSNDSKMSKSYASDKRVNAKMKFFFGMNHLYFSTLFALIHFVYWCSSLLTLPNNKIDPTKLAFVSSITSSFG